MFQTGKFGEEGADVGMAGEQASEKGEVSRLQGGGDGVGERNSGGRWKETGATDLGRGRDLAIDAGIEPGPKARLADLFDDGPGGGRGDSKRGVSDDEG